MRNGGGLVGFHSATDTFHHWPAYLRLIGAEFSHHPHPSTERVIVEDRTTPATDTLPPSFQIGEEFYVFKRDPRPNVHVLREPRHAAAQARPSACVVPPLRAWQGLL